jgi:hypothetical protein
MPDDTSRALVCLIEGESTPFDVELAGNKKIMNLKDLIKEKGINPTEHAVLAKDLNLWKVRMTLVVFRSGSDITDDTDLAYGGYPYHSI